MKNKKTKVCIVKRRGHKEDFDEKKLYASCYAACLSTMMKPRQAENICEKVSRQITKELKRKKCITSDELFHITIELLDKYDKDVAFMYQTHRDVS